MTVQNFLESYGGNACVTIEGYCEEKIVSYCDTSCFEKESWWEEVCDKKIEMWNVIGGGDYKSEVYISIKNE